MSRLIAILALLLGMALLAPAAADASELSQRGGTHPSGHGGSVTINVTPAHGVPFGFRAPIGWGGRFINGCFRFCGPAVLGVPFLPPPVVPVAVAVPVPVAQPVAVGVPLPTYAPAPVALPQYTPALPAAAPCGCPPSP